MNKKKEGCLLGVGGSEGVRGGEAGKGEGEGEVDGGRDREEREGKVEGVWGNGEVCVCSQFCTVPVCSPVSIACPLRLPSPPSSLLLHLPACLPSGPHPTIFPASPCFFTCLPTAQSLHPVGQGVGKEGGGRGRGWNGGEW